MDQVNNTKEPNISSSCHITCFIMLFICNLGNVWQKKRKYLGMSERKKENIEAFPYAAFLYDLLFINIFS